MSRELRIDVRPAGAADSAQVTLSGDGQPALQQFPRRLPTQVNAVTLDRLRRGEAKPLEVEELSRAVSDWVLGPDLRQILNVLVRPGPTPPVRLIFSVDQSFEDALGPLPLELLKTDPGGTHLVVHPQVDSLVRLLPKVVPVSVNEAALKWPMRILMIRANPADQGGRVPPAAPLRKEILDLATNTLGAGSVEVDLLSREDGSAGHPTWGQFINAAKAAQYDLLIYFGHGDIQPLYEDQPPLSQLQFEAGDGHEHEPVTAGQLASVLRQYPIPVVILAGCLTAADPAGGDEPDMAMSAQGNQGVAQALVNSDSGVTLAVGMQSKVDGEDMSWFLKAFFEALFSGGDAIGHVERSIRSARQQLSFRRLHPPTWTSPVVFSNLMPEPIFKYLRDRTVVPTPEMNKQLEIRRGVLWPMLAEMPAPLRPQTLVQGIVENRTLILSEMVRRAAVLLPELTEARPGATIRVPVTVEGMLSVTSLQARVALSAGLRFGTVRSTPTLIGAGYQVLVDNDSSGVFQIQLRPGAAKPANLPTGVLFEFELTVDAAALGVCTVNLEVLETDAIQPYWAGHNAVIVQM